MIVAYYLSLADSGSHMFRDDSSLTKCRKCGYRLDFFAHNPSYMLRNTKYDLCATYDGQIIGSRAFKAFCENEGLSGIDFLSFDADDEHFHVILRNVVPFDAAKARTRFENLCEVCGNYESIIGVTPFLKVSAPLADGIYRSDLLFASGNEKGPAEFAAPLTREKMITARLRGIHFEGAMGLEL
jgi:hypothetical protein